MTTASTSIYDFDANTWEFSLGAAAIGVVASLCANSSFMAVIYGIPMDQTTQEFLAGFVSVNTTWYVLDSIGNMIVAALTMGVSGVGIYSLYQHTIPLNDTQYMFWIYWVMLVLVGLTWVPSVLRLLQGAYNASYYAD